MTGRTFGTTQIELTGRDDLAKPLALTLERDFPAVWAMPSNPNQASINRVKVEYDSRAGWKAATRTILMSNGDTSNPRTMSTAIHELTHVAESNRAGIKHAEFVFWHQRAGGEKVKSFFALEGFGPKNEFSVGDKWANKYSGRVYSYDKKPARNDFFEILSTGMEGLYYGSKSSGATLIDSEHAAFTLAMVMFG